MFLLVIISSIPAIAVFLWFHIARYPFSLLRFLLFLLAGAAAFFPALFLQRIFPSGDFASSGRTGLFMQVFIRIALSEELSRLLILSILFWLSRRIGAASAGNDAADRYQTISYSALMLGTAAGLVAGLGFAIIESAAYGASDAGVTLLRVFTSAPLHGACGARVGSAAIMFRRRPVQALFHFFSAVVIHGVYNTMIVLPRLPTIAAVLIALSALASSVLAIRSGLSTADKGMSQPDSTTNTD